MILYFKKNLEKSTTKICLAESFFLKLPDFLNIFRKKCLEVFLAKRGLATGIYLRNFPKY